MRTWSLLLLSGLACVHSSLGGELILTDFAVPAPPGPHCPIAADQLTAVHSYRADQPTVGTYFFCWHDSVDPNASVREGAFRAQGDLCRCGQTGQWRRVTFRIGGGRFANRCNGADFRFAVLGGDLAVTGVVARRAP